MFIPAAHCESVDDNDDDDIDDDDGGGGGPLSERS